MAVSALQSSWTLIFSGPAIGMSGRMIFGLEDVQVNRRADQLAECSRVLGDFSRFSGIR
jgi:hypothetical protein